MEIVNMNVDHIPQVAALEAACFSLPWSADCLNAELHNELALWLVAVEGDTVAGYVGSQTVLGESDMMNLAVAPAFRRRGLGAQLVRALMDALKSGGSQRLTLEVRASNAPARSLYEGLGFAQVGLRKNYYRAPKEDGVILGKKL